MKIDVGQLRKWKVALPTDVVGTMFQVIRIGNVAAEGQEYVTGDLLGADGQISKNWHAIYIDANSIDLTES